MTLAEQDDMSGFCCTLEEISNSSLFLLSDLSAGITGQTIYVDAGYSIIGDNH